MKRRSRGVWELLRDSLDSHRVPLVLRKKGRLLMTFRTMNKELRARYDLTQEDLGRKVGVRRETILYLEKGTYNPSLELAHSVAKALKTTMDDLFAFEDKG